MIEEQYKRTRKRMDYAPTFPLVLRVPGYGLQTIILRRSGLRHWTERRPSPPSRLSPAS